MNRAFPSLLFLVSCLAFATASATESPGAEARGAMDGGEARIHARLLVDHASGENSAKLGVLFEMDPGWHLYWRNPGDSGLAPVLRFGFPMASGAGQTLEAQTLEVGELAWPAPQAFDEDVDILTFGYLGSVLLAAPVRWAAGNAPPQRVRVDADVLVCADQCIPAKLVMERPFATAGSERERVTALFESAALRVPSAASEHGLRVALEWTEQSSPDAPFSAALVVEPCGGASDCALRAPGSARTAFFPYGPKDLLLRSVGIEREGGAYRIELQGDALAPIDVGEPLRGVLALREGGELRAFEVALPLVPSSGSREAGATPAPGVTLVALLRALALGVLGGLLLNLMPCVLPVLAMKVFAVAELAQQGRREVIRHAFAYTAGILATLLMLALVVVALRWSGTAVGWGFHLQEPIFVAVVAAVLVAFAANLLGAFEFEVTASGLAGLGQDASGARRSFFDGLLAVILATPCSAPFLGTAVGFAFASGAPVIIAIFLAIGLGLAAPFIAVAIVPGWARWMPRSGPWMLELRKGLGFALLATVGWLLWVVGRSAGVDAMAGLLMLLLAVGFATWVFGLVQRTRGRAPGALLATGLAVLLVAGLGQVEFERQPEGAVAGTREGAPIPYTPAALSEALATGRPAFVYFTADWCLTCKLNERRVLADPRTQEALASHGFSVLRADWTRRDESIRKELAKLGKAGVPVYALYEPGRPDAPRLQPELLRLEPFLNALAQTADESRRAAKL